MTIPNFVEVDGILLPSFLFSFSERKSKSISPAALINPANVNGGNIFQSLISPSDIPSKKTLIFDGQIDVVWTRDKQIGFLQQLKLLGFDVYLCVSSQNENNFLKLDDDLSNINQLNNFSDFNKLSDYEKLADLNISREKSVFLDLKKLNEVKNCFVGHSWENYFQAVNDDEVFDLIKKYYESYYGKKNISGSIVYDRSPNSDIYKKFNSLTANQIKNAFEQNENFSLKYLELIDKKIISEEQLTQLVKENIGRIEDFSDLKFCLTVLSNSPNEVNEILENTRTRTRFGIMI
jgi:hypothetical protein